jgi:hypothetical protein
MIQYWFRPKSHGYGATPSSWQGWALVLAHLVLVVGTAVPVLVLPTINGPPGPELWQVLLWGLVVAVSTWALVRISRAKTDGEWKWRWGEKK